MMSLIINLMMTLVMSLMKMKLNKVSLFYNVCSCVFLKFLKKEYVLFYWVDDEIHCSILRIM